MEDVPDPSKEARIQRGHERLGRGKKTAEKVLPRGMKEGVACLRRFSSETDGLPGLDCGITGLCVWCPQLPGGAERRPTVVRTLI